MTVKKPKPKQLLRPIETGADSAMNQSQFQAISCNLLKAWEKSWVHGAIDLFSLYVLFSHFRPHDATPENSFFQVSAYARANVRITCEKTKGNFP